MSPAMLLEYPQDEPDFAQADLLVRQSRAAMQMQNPDCPLSPARFDHAGLQQRLEPSVVQQRMIN